MFHYSFRALKLHTSKTLPEALLHASMVTSFFAPSNFYAFGIIGKDPLLFESYDSVFEHMVHLLSCPITLTFIDSSFLVPVFAVHNQTLSAPSESLSISVNSSDHVVPSHMGFAHLPSWCMEVFSQPRWSFVAFHVLCLQKTHLSFGFGVSSSQSCHSSAEQRKAAAYGVPCQV